MASEFGGIRSEAADKATIQHVSERVDARKSYRIPAGRDPDSDTYPWRRTKLVPGNGATTARRIRPWGRNDTESCGCLSSHITMILPNCSGRPHGERGSYGVGLWLLCNAPLR